MIESCVLGPKTGPERQTGYQTNIPPTPGIAMQGLLMLCTDISYQDLGMEVQELLGIIRMETELGHLYRSQIHTYLVPLDLYKLGLFFWVVISWFGINLNIENRVVADCNCISMAFVG